jgi:hypothetical protein
MEIATALLQRFPLLAAASLEADDSDSVREAIPAFMGIFLAAMQSPLRTPVCFVLPRRGDVPRLAAVLYGLHRFAMTQPDLMKQYIDRSFEAGDFVRVHPNKHVFRFDGFDEAFPGFLRLLPPSGAVSGLWRIPASRFALRLERTTAKSPAGRMNLDIHDPPPAPLDQLLGTATFGNQALFRNEVLLLDTASGFQEFLEITALRPLSIPGDDRFPPLKSLVPCGSVTPSIATRIGWLVKWDAKSPTGEPLIAVTSSAPVAANFCIDMPAFGELVVVNGLSRIKDLQSFDDIQATQRMVLFADESEEDLIRAFQGRGCLIWEVTAAELDTGCPTPATPVGMGGQLRVWARNKEQLRLDTEVCEGEALDAICISLQSVRRPRDREEDDPLDGLFGRIWRVLNDAARAIGPLREEERTDRLNQLGQCRSELRRCRPWLTPETEAALTQSVSALEAVIKGPSDLGTSKRAALARIMADCARSRVTYAVVVRSENQAIDVRKQLGPGVKVCTPRELDEGAGVERLVCLSWLTGEVMEGIALTYSSPRITLLAYPFERRWMSQCAARIHRRAGAGRIGPSEKEALIAGAGLPRLDAPHEETRPEPIVADTDDDIWAFEQRLRAARKGSAASPTEASETVACRYVSFVGATYAFLTEGHRVIVATDLLSKAGRARQRLPERVAADLRKGDFIVFPESGDRELVQKTADQLLGVEGPKLRKTARLWKEALQASGLTPPQFLRHAVELGRPRHVMTIRNWFAETSQIGPGLGDEDLSEDLELISLVTNHDPLKLNLPKVIEAVKKLRSAHLSAGIRLREVLIHRLPEVTGKVEEEGTLIDLADLGSAWIVQVDSVAPASEPRGRAEANRLLWDDTANAMEIPF